MIQFFAMVVFMMLAFGIMAAALHFSEYKKKEESCCGGGHCSVSHDHDHEHDENHVCEGHCSTDGTHGCSSGTCYNEKIDFVNNLEKIKFDRLKH
jgi:hypothetical protein